MTLKITAPTPWLKNSTRGFTIALMSMDNRVIHIPRGHAPLPIKNGLNPTRARVPEDFAGRPALDFLWHLISTQRRRNPADTIEAARERFHQGQVVASRGQLGTFLAESTLLSLNDDLWFYRMPTEEAPIPFSCEIIHEDDRLLVVDKPPFLATMPRGKHITQTATVQLRRTTGIEDLAPAHRLDRLTSGVLVFTKERRYRGAYQTLFAERKAQKTYEAVAAFDYSIEPGTVWRHRIEKIPGIMQAKIIEGQANSETLLAEVKLLPQERSDQLAARYGMDGQLATYVLKPATGKTHQLRVHMFAAGVPILGDPTYPRLLPETEESFAHPMHLTARQLEFVDPITGEAQRFESTRVL